MWLSQTLLAVFGLSAVYMSMVSESLTAKKWAPVVGLIAQPFWLYSGIQAKQWGAVTLCVVYSAIYLKAASKSMRVRHLPTKETSCPSTRK